VWLGNDDGSPTKGLTGGQLPAQAWHDFMTAAHEGVPVAQLPGGWNGRVLSDIESVLSQSSDGGNVATAPTGSVQPAAQGGGRIGSIMDIILGN
jgi:penicillin-binding protein 1A